ncbi:MAG: DM13 domain-containing protein [Chloroflexi bacterium]|nr:DM13 domain-containing protein [Chloroflexota bacterium]
MGSDEVILSEAAISGPEARGTARLIRQASGAVVLRVEAYWIAEGAPDARFYLTPDAGGAVNVDGVIDFGKMDQLTGTVEFALPEGVDPASLGAVVVYCKAYSVEFGKGALQATA